MRLTKKKAIEITKEMWTELAETGSDSKGAWLEARGYVFASDCAFCEYSRRQEDVDCESCPYDLMFGECSEGFAPYDKWRGAKTKSDRKEYAREFLEQVKQLR